MPDYGDLLKGLFQNSSFEPLSIIGNKLDSFPAESSYEIPFKQMMDYTHAFTDVKNFLIMKLHAHNLTQETYFLKEDVCRESRYIFK